MESGGRASRQGPSRRRGLKPEGADLGMFQTSNSRNTDMTLRVKAPVLPSGITGQAVHSQGDLKPNCSMDSLWDLTLVSQPLWFGFHNS